MNANNSRRNFLKTAAVSGVMAASIPEIVSAAYTPSRTKKIPLSDDDILLVQGDSITDWHRKRDDDKPNSPGALGTGYQALPDVRLIIGEPYAVIGVKAVDDQWYPALNDYRAAAKEIAESFGAVFVPYQEIYDKAQKSAPGSYWTIDGVHQSLAGARLMAEAWMATIHG
jgi:hypothetical protein